MKRTAEPDKVRRKRPEKAAAVFLAVCIGIMLAGGLFLRFGTNPDQIHLETQQGDAAVLDGFVLSGVNQGMTSEIRFCLENGQIRQKSNLKSSLTGDGMASDTLYIGQSYAVMPEDRKTLGSNLSKGYFSYQQQGVGMFYTSQYALSLTGAVTRAYEMIDLTLRDPNVEESRSLHFPFKIVQFSEPATAYTTVYADRTQDYYVSASVPQNSDAELISGTVLDDKVYVAVDDVPGLLVDPGLYRVDQLLTGEEIDALPRDAEVEGYPILASSTPYGSMTKLCDFTGKTHLADLRTAGGLLWLPQKQPDGSVAIEFYNPEGSLAASFPISGWQEESALYGLDSLKDDEAAFVYCPQGNESEDLPRYFYVLRLDNGTITAQGMARSDAAQNSVAAASLSADGKRLLLVCRDLAWTNANGGPADAENRYQTRLDAYRLEVYDGAAGQNLYTGLLDLGRFLRWTDNIRQNGTLMPEMATLASAGRIQLDTYEQRLFYWPEKEE